MPKRRFKSFSRKTERTSVIENCEGSEHSSSSPSTSKDNSASNSGLDYGTPEGLARKEHNAVQYSKLLVYVVLLLAALGVCSFAFVFLRKDQTDSFEAQFNGFAIEILDSAETNAEKFLGNLQGVSNTITSYTWDTEKSWPNATLPNFDIRMTNSFETLVGAEMHIFAPIVYGANRSGFESYAWDNQGWIVDDLALRGLSGVRPGRIPRKIYSYYDDYEEEIQEKDFYVPIWQVSPVPTSADIIMLDLYSHPSLNRMISDCIQVQHTLLSEVVDRSFLSDNIETLDQDPDRDVFPRSYSIEPIYNRFDGTPELVGFIFAIIPWDTYFVDVLPQGIDGFVVRVLDSCGASLSYRLDGPEVTYLGEDFEPNPDYEHMVLAREFAEFARFDGESTNDYVTHCSYSLELHPTEVFASVYLDSNQPIVYAVIIFVVFFFTALVFFIYDVLVQRRQDKVLMAAQRTGAIVASLFPKNVQKRMLAEAAAEYDAKRSSGKDKLKNFFSEDTSRPKDHVAVFKTKPIADFFPETTIMFADIVGFTAWSSTREPSQVFTLLETIYHQFDTAAKKRRVFKVETVGDCYVAVAGLPDPMKDHAIVMARFARECLYQLNRLLEKLEVSLGPDTADLGMRVGLHSGPVTAGVLRGDRSRFQLFGDTMNTASRMESTGRRNMIQISKELADHLVKSGKSTWIQPRRDLVFVKGKGEMQTFWLESDQSESPASEGGLVRPSTVFAPEASEHGYDDLHSVTCSVTSHEGSEREMGIPMLSTNLSDKVLRLVDWNVDLLSGLLREIEARRMSTRTSADSDAALTRLEDGVLDQTETVLSEVKEVIKMPDYTHSREQLNPERVMLEGEVVKQLHAYIQEIARMYHDNPFHNFEHASHVTMSVVKLFSRIIAPDVEHVGATNEKSLHDHTYGITSDPLTQFAVIISALVHDADHPGVPNSQLIVEHSPLATAYKNKSIAEQNSIDLAWDLLMQDEFKSLRRRIYRNEAEFLRFRSLMVNTVLATDIMDKDLKTLRNNRWDKAFSETRGYEESAAESTNRKATIVIEHLIQASDVAHTMQHWHIYRKWNTRLFEEMYKAFVQGRSEKDPTEFWYKGELGFLDFYVIPLAKKLKECGVFGVSSDEYLQYALNNRSEWERKGQEVLKELVASAEMKVAAIRKKQKSKSKGASVEEP
eukprot:Nitzschia sp. Nitz4//scaffold23_size168460//26387//30285//NITZ4_002207-RA/size168460-snap-gene-0.151-mRNA-1//-1//CDS//3329543599//2003//frame0